MADKDDASARKGLTLAGTATLLAGLSTFAPGFKDAALALLNKTFDLGFSEIPSWIAFTLVLIGTVMLVLSFFGQSRFTDGLGSIFGKKTPKGPVIAIKQIGFSPAVRDLNQSELPTHLSGREIQNIIIDITQDLSAQPPQLNSALLKQHELSNQLTILRNAQPGAEIAFCGIIQAPFQILAGYQLSTWVNAQTFEWHRTENRWIALQTGNPLPLRPTTHVESVGAGDDVAIAVEVSAKISSADIIASIPSLKEIVRLGLSSPRLDCITHEGQVIELSNQFRSLLDDLHSRLAPNARVHVLVAAPMSVGFGLGRMISRTLHPPVIAYAYARNGLPPYQWGLLINAAAGAQQVVWN